MKDRRVILFGFVVGWVLLFAARAEAQLHRATRLGHPATRFAPPLVTSEDLRARFRDEKLKPDIAEILRQWGWKGKVEDLHRAALSAEITELKLPVGTRMPFMSSRENGKPITLRDVLWAGQEPVGAYAFTFSSNGRRYRCVTPKPCSNFFLEDLGPEPPRIQLIKTAPEEASLCAPFEMKLTVRNSGSVAATQVRVVDALPAGLETTDHQTKLSLEAGTLQLGASRDFRFQVMAASVGNYVNTARATCAGGGNAEATARTIVRAPTLNLECAAPAEVLAPRPAEVCLTVRNSGDAPEPKTTLTLPIPQGAILASSTEGGVSSTDQVTWEIPNLAPGASRKVCARFILRQPGSLSFTPTARGSCAQPVESSCATRVAGVAAILLEVVDLEDPVEVNHEVTYVIKVTNQGSSSGTNIRLVCQLPFSQEFVSGTGPTAVQAQDGQITLEPLSTLDPKEVASWRVVVKALKVDDARFKVELRSDQFERPIREDESTQQY